MSLPYKTTIGLRELAEYRELTATYVSWRNAKKIASKLDKSCYTPLHDALYPTHKVPFPEPTLEWIRSGPSWQELEPTLDYPSGLFQTYVLVHHPNVPKKYVEALLSTDNYRVIADAFEANPKIAHILLPLCSAYATKHWRTHLDVEKHQTVWSVMENILAANSAALSLSPPVLPKKTVDLITEANHYSTLAYWVSPDVATMITSQINRLILPNTICSHRLLLPMLAVPLPEQTLSFLYDHADPECKEVLAAILAQTHSKPLIDKILSKPSFTSFSLAFEYDPARVPLLAQQLAAKAPIRFARLLLTLPAEHLALVPRATLAKPMAQATAKLRKQLFAKLSSLAPSITDPSSPAPTQPGHK